MTVRCEMRKWNGFPTYRFDGDLLGRDEYGTWLGLRASTTYIGPKGERVWRHNLVWLLPSDVSWVAAFNDEDDPKNVDVYVDMTALSEWVNESSFRTVDMDLDVVRYHDGRVTLKDEDEFEERRLEMGYPDDVVQTVRAKANDLLEAVRARTEPFDAVGRRWLEKLLDA